MGVIKQTMELHVSQYMINEFFDILIPYWMSQYISTQEPEPFNYFVKFMIDDLATTHLRVLDSFAYESIFFDIDNCYNVEYVYDDVLTHSIPMYREIFNQLCVNVDLINQVYSQIPIQIPISV